MREQFKINGFTDSVNCCDRCGKTNLKGTYHIETSNGGSYYLGSSCIKKAYQMTQKEFTQKVSEEEMRRILLCRDEWNNSEIGKFYKAYIGSEEHRQDIEKGGFSVVCKKTKPADKFKAELCKKYDVRSNKVCF